MFVWRGAIGRWLLMLGLVALLIIPQMADAQVETDAAALDAITNLVADMNAAVNADEAETYLRYVDLSDPFFAVEHSNWVRDWRDGDFLSRFKMTISDVQVIGDEAHGILTYRYNNDIGLMAAAFPAAFHYDAASSAWRYAGEYWQTTQTGHFIIYATPEQSAVVAVLVDMLPEIYETVTAAYDYVPQAQMAIKLYDSREALSATTLLSLPLIFGWNEPNESLKVITNAPERLPGIVAHEFTHFLSFDQAGGRHSLMPWWLEEGIAEYMRGVAIGTPCAGLDATRTALRVGSFVEWDAISSFETTPVELWQAVYPQGCAFVTYVSETYGDELRNAWLAAMAQDMTLEPATEAAIGMTFHELDDDFRAWACGGESR